MAEALHTLAMIQQAESPEVGDKALGSQNMALEVRNMVSTTRYEFLSSLAGSLSICPKKTMRDTRRPRVPSGLCTLGEWYTVLGSAHYCHVRLHAGVLGMWTDRVHRPQWQDQHFGTYHHLCFGVRDAPIAMNLTQFDWLPKLVISSALTCDLPWLHAWTFDALSRAYRLAGEHLLGRRCEWINHSPPSHIHVQPSVISALILLHRFPSFSGTLLPSASRYPAVHSLRCVCSVQNR